MRARSLVVASLVLFLPVLLSAEQRRSPVPQGYLVLKVYPTIEGFAFTAEKEGKVWAFVGQDGEPQGPYDQVYGASWSPDGSTFAYLAKVGASWFAVSGGKRLDEDDAQDLRAFAWPVGCSAPLYATKTGDSWFVHAEGKREGPYQDVKVLYRDGFRDLAIVGSNKGAAGSYLYRRGLKVGPIYAPDYLAWAEDGSAFYFSSYDYAQKNFFLIGGPRRYGPYTQVRQLWPSPNGASVAYVAATPAGMGLYQDGRRLMDIGNSFSIPRWSPDGVTLVYVDGAEGAAYAVAGDRREGPYELIYSLAASQDGKMAYGAKEGGSWYIHDGESRRGPFASKPQQLEYSPDGSVLAAIVWDGKGMAVYKGDKKIGSYGEHVNSLFWSPDGTALCYRVDDGGPFLYMGDKRFSGFHNFYTRWWSEDGATLEYQTVLIYVAKRDLDFSKVFRGGKMLTGGLVGNRVVYVDGDGFVEE
jgi:hypothetical protein